MTLFIKAYANTIKTHIKNDSEKPWIVTFTIIKGSLDEVLTGCKEKQECLINPKSSRTIFYKIDNGLKGMIVVTDYKDQRKAFNIDIDNSVPSLTVLDDICPNDIDINITYDKHESWLSQEAGGEMIIKYPYLCWSGNL